jgi:hypothetical protein
MLPCRRLMQSRAALASTSSKCLVSNYDSHLSRLNIVVSLRWLQLKVWHCDSHWRHKSSTSSQSKSADRVVDDDGSAPQAIVLEETRKYLGTGHQVRTVNHSLHSHLLQRLSEISSRHCQGIVKALSLTGSIFKFSKTFWTINGTRYGWLVPWELAHRAVKEIT